MTDQPKFVTLHLLSMETADTIDKQSYLGPLAKALGATWGRCEVEGERQPGLILRARLRLLDNDLYRHTVLATTTLTPQPMPCTREEIEAYAALMRAKIMAALVAEIVKTVGV